MKTNRLLAIIMVCCMGVASAFAHPNKVTLAGGDDCASATPIPMSDIDIDGNGQVTCIISDNIGATSSGSTPACWAGAEDADVWFKFVPKCTGWWTISTDNGINDFGEDTQLALRDSSCGGATIACNEDLGAETESNNGLAAGFTVFLDSGKCYFLQVDIFGTTQGKFALTIFKNKKPKNSCIDYAYTVDDAYDNFGDCFHANGWFIYNPYTYSGPTTAEDSAWDPCRTLITFNTLDNIASNGCNSDQAVDANNNRIYNDVWLKFTYTAGDPASWINIYPKNGWPRYGVELFTGTPGTSPNCDTISSGLTRIGCSLPDGFLESGRDARDRAEGNFFDHPRVEFDPVGAGLTGGETIYLRVYQYTRLLVGDTSNTIATPSEGLFKVAFEVAGDNENGNCTANHKGVDHSCCAGITNITPGSCRTGHQDPCEDEGEFLNLCNAGMNGGLSAAEGSTARPAGRANEPGTYQYDGVTTVSTGNGNCEDSSQVNVISAFSLFNNNSAYYRFDVCSTYTAETNIDQLDELFAVTLYNPLDETFEDTVLFASILTCQGITAGGLEPLVPAVVVGPILGGLTGLLGDCCAPTSCEPRTTFCFKNLDYCGVNGATFEAYIVPADASCDDDVANAIALAAALPESACDECLCFRPTQPLAPGAYDLVVDGESGSLVKFDLEVKTEWVIPGTTVCCEECDTGILNVAKKDNTVQNGLTNGDPFDHAIRPKYLAPSPAQDYVDFGYTSPVEGTVQFTIVDLNGKAMQEGTFNAIEGENKHRFNVESLSSGMYVVRMRINGMETQMKLMKK